MAKRALAVALGLLMLLGAPASLLGGEKAPKRQPRKRPEPVSTADYIKAVQQLLEVAAELEKPGAEAKGQELRDKAKAACTNLRLSGPAAERMLAVEDNKALAARLKGYVYNSVRGKVTYERQKLIKSKPELEAEYKKFQDREKQLAADKEAFYKTLRPQSPDLDELEKMREALVAERERLRQEAAAKRKADMEARRKKAAEGKPKRERRKNKEGQ